MKKILWLIYQPYKWLIFTPILGLSAAILSINAVVLAKLISPRVGSMVSGIAWSRLCSAITPMFVKVVGRENLDKKKSYIIVCNHQSHFDIFVVYGWLMTDIKFVMKQELRKVPFIGWACEVIEFIYIDRSDNQKAIESLNNAKSKIVNGTSAIFFPEGTRSRDGKIGKFKKGAFRMAMDLKLPILPVTINGTRKILPSHSFNLKPGTAEMIIHPAISTEGYTDSNVEELIEKTKNIISSQFKNPD